MSISHKKNKLNFQYFTNNAILSEVQSYKYLGLWITNDLNWTKHIDIVTSKANQKLFFLRRTLKLSPPSVRVLAYKSIVLPILDYAAVIWDPFTQTNIHKVEKVQRRAVRFIYNSYGRTSVNELLVRANLL